MLNKNLLRKNDSGRSIVEMLGVLAIMGVITVMGIQGYSQAMGKINRSKVIEQVTEMAQEVRSLYATRATYNQTDKSDGGFDIGKELLEKMGMSLSAPYGGEYTVFSVGKVGGNVGFVISVPNIPISDCLYFLTMQWNDVMDNELKAPATTAYFGTSFAEGSSAVTGNSCSDNTVNVMSVYFK